MNTPKLKFLATLSPHLENARILGATPEGERKIVPVSGGRIEGSRLSGRILPGGGDWARITANGVLQLDVRLTMQTHDDALIYISYTGMRHGPANLIAALARGEEVDSDKMYFRIQPRFETSDARYEWLNRILCVGMGERLPDGPRYFVYELL